MAFSSGDGFLDPLDAGWSNDTELVPVDLNKVSARSFVVYKFGCFVADLLASRCRHVPVTLLLADTVPASKELKNNSYRNSFLYDANNRILYMRAARLETVGDFVLVLVHTLAHIKAGERNKKNHNFVLVLVQK